jgi:hypothetical protein
VLTRAHRERRKRDWELVLSRSALRPPRGDHAVPLKECGRRLAEEPFHFLECIGGFALSSVLAVIHSREQLRGKLSFGLGRGVYVARNGL